MTGRSRCIELGDPGPGPCCACAVGALPCPEIVCVEAHPPSLGNVCMRDRSWCEPGHIRFIANPIYVERVACHSTVSNKKKRADI
jgi:hypothetical protein